jgi:uncharacterized protein (DUF2062 family)
MAIKDLKFKIPSREEILAINSLKFMHGLISEPNLWHFNRRSVSRAALIGLFWCMIPMPFQMVPAAFLAFYLTANVPLSLALVWISNPITMPPMFFATYKFGAWLLGTEPVDSFEFTAEWLTNGLSVVWKPLYFGSAVTGIILAITGYIGVQIIWRYRVVKKWKARAANRLKTTTPEKSI